MSMSGQGLNQHVIKIVSVQLLDDKNLSFIQLKN